MFCHLCATRIEEGDFFCRNCGEESVPVLAELNRRNWLRTVGFFTLGVVGFGAFAIMLPLLVLFLFPSMKDPLTVMWVLFILGVLVAGLGAAVLGELADTKRKLKGEREKRRTSLSRTARPAITQGQEPQMPNGSVTEPTTVKMMRP